VPVWSQGQAFKTRDDSHEAERSFNDEMALFYHGPQPTRCAPAAATPWARAVRVPGVSSSCAHPSVARLCVGARADGA
jgi:hypothetical protein